MHKSLGTSFLVLSVAFVSALIPLHNASAASIPSTPGWFQIPNTALRTVCPPDNYGGVNYLFSYACQAVTGSWNSGVIDTARNRLIVWGGGHNDYYGNEIYAVNLNDLSIQRLNNPGLPLNLTGSCGVTTLADGSPNSRHTYDGIAYMPNVDKMFVYGGATSCPAGGFTNDTWTFNFANSTWEKIFENSPLPGYGIGPVSAYDPNTGKLFVINASSWTNLYAYDPVAKTYQQLGGASQVAIDYHMSAVIDPVKKKMVIVGGGGSSQGGVVIYDIAPGSTYQPQRVTTTGGSSVVNSNYPGLAYDPVSGHIVAWNGGDTVYSLNLDTNVWTPITYPGGPGPAQVNGTNKRWSYSPTSGVFVLVNDMNQNAYTFRLAAGGTPPAPLAPAVTMSSSPTSVSLGSSATLTWSSTNATACTASGGWTGSRSVSGSQSVVPSANTMYILSCTGTGGTGTQSAAVSVISSPTAINGSCGSANGVAVTSAPSTNLCSTGTASAVSGSGPWSWSCAGSSGGTTVSCSAPVVTTPPPPTGSQVTSFNLNSIVGGTQPFTVGLGFKKGDIPGTPQLNIANQQVIVMRRWNDGSVKHAIASGQVTLTAGTPLTVTVSGVSAAPSGTNLTAASIQAANPQASISFGSYGTVNLSTLLATPFRTFISGPEMVEAHYRAQVGTDPSLVAWFYVRLYKNGKVWIRTVGENGYLDVPTADKSYVPTVTIGGTQVWNNSGAVLTQYAHTRWTQEGWIGGDPQIIPQLDTTYLKASGLVPNYMPNTPSSATLSGLYQTYAPNQSGNWTPSMGETGYQDQIGLLPLWDALYITSGADARAYRSVIANAKALNSYPIEWNDSATKLPVKPSDRPTWGLDGPNGGGDTNRTAGSLTWEIAHHGSGGYLAYLITGDYYYLETMENQSATTYLMAGSADWSTNPASNNYGTSRYFNGQTRGYAWVLRTLSQYAGIAPSGDVIAADYRSLLSNNILHLKSIKDAVSPPGIGYLYEYDANLYGVGTVAPWQQHFFIQSLGMGSDLEPLSTMTTYNEVRDYLYRGAVGILGDGNGYCFNSASVYNLKSNNGTSNNPNGWYKDWAQVYAGTFVTPPACTNTLGGASGGDPSVASQGYWGNLMPAIAYAVDDVIPGAAAAWTRLTGASNWSTVLNSGFNNVPEWGVIPRTSIVVPPSVVNGSCGSANGVAVTSAPSTNLCSTGTASAVSGSGPWSWSCAGSSGGTTASCSAQVQIAPPTGDTVAPSIPNSLSVSGVSSNQISLSWNPSTDNVGVTGYRLNRNGVALVSLGNVTSYTNTGLLSGNAYSYAVAAYDVAGNTSALSSTVSTSTTAAVVPPATFSIGARVKTAAKLSIRVGASTNNKRLCFQPTGSLGTILAGPTLKNGYSWWQINFDTGCDGWATQTYLALASTALAPITQTLASGATGDEVIKLQNLLTTLGFFKMDSTGYFGRVTQSAVAQFQAVNNLAAVGSVGPKTLAFLKQLMGR